MITLLPKNGDDRLLKNWRPITLLSCNLKFYTKCLSLRLKRVLPDLIHADQTCGIPGRHIYDSIALSRDIIDYAKGDIPMSIINIDQEKAFDRVSHKYLFRVLKAFGLGDRFISYIKLCYIDVSSFININGSVCAHSPRSTFRIINTRFLGQSTKKYILLK